MELWDKISEYSHLSGIDNIIASSSAVICAFSGGADSSVLLHWLKRRLCGSNTLLVCAHVNHMIRGKESDRDEEFCRRRASELEIPFYLHRIDIPSAAKERGIGLEECARDERYSFLTKLSDELGGAIIATAHSATDNVETVIFNLCRGCGTKGITGVDPVRENLIRPLLGCTSEEIREFAKSKKIEFVVDSTNSDTSYTRNYIRAVIVPSLRRLNPRADEAFLRLGSAARSDCEYIEKAAAEFLSTHIPVKKDDLAGVLPALFARVIGLMWKGASGSATDLSSKNIADCRRLVLSGYGRIDLGGGYSFFCRKDSVYIKKCEKNEEAPEPKELIIGKDTDFGRYNISVLRERRNIYNLSTETVIDFDKIYGKLYVRCRQAGDMVLSGKMHKKLKKLMCDKNVPSEERDIMPVICDDKGIAAVPGLVCRDGVSGGNNRIYIYIENKTDDYTAAAPCGRE